MRIKCGKTTRRRKKKLFREAKGFRAGRGNLYRQMVVTLIRARCFAYRDRRVRKRDFRALWILRINAAVRERGLNYSQFINGLKLANLELNRKTLSELAINSPAVFDEIFAVAKAALDNKPKTVVAAVATPA